MHLIAFIVIVALVLVIGLALRRKPAPPTSVEPAVIAAFRRTYLQMWCLGIPSAALLVWATLAPASAGPLQGLLVLVAVVLVGALCLFTWRNWRCPKCHAYLGRNPMYDWRCPNCGTALREPRDS